MQELVAYTMLAVLVIVLVLTRVAMKLDGIDDGVVYHIEYVDADHIRLIKIKE